MTPLRRRATAAVVAVAALSGCGVHAGRRAAAADVCVGALPVAAAVAGPGARLTRVERLTVRQVRELVPAAPSAPAQAIRGASSAAPRPVTPTLCAVAYRGRFDVARLPATVRASGTTGPVLVLLVSTRHAHVFAALVRPALPPQLSH